MTIGPVKGNGNPLVCDKHRIVESGANLGECPLEVRLAEVENEFIMDTVENLDT